MKYNIIIHISIPPSVFTPNAQVHFGVGSKISIHVSIQLEWYIFSHKGVKLFCSYPTYFKLWKSIQYAL